MLQQSTAMQWDTVISHIIIGHLEFFNQGSYIWGIIKILATCHWLLALLSLWWGGHRLSCPISSTGLQVNNAISTFHLKFESPLSLFPSISVEHWEMIHWYLPPYTKKINYLTLIDKILFLSWLSVTVLKL